MKLYNIVLLLLTLLFSVTCGARYCFLDGGFVEENAAFPQPRNCSCKVGKKWDCRECSVYDERSSSYSIFPPGAAWHWDETTSCSCAEDGSQTIRCKQLDHDSDSGKDCIFNGNEYFEFESFKSQNKVCQCRQATVYCGILNSTCWYWRDNLFQVGENWRENDIVYTCNAGGEITATLDEGPDDEGCTTEDDKIVPNGDWYRQGINKCFCQAGSITCYVDPLYCVYEGSVYNHEQNFSVGYKNCACHNGEVTCDRGEAPGCIYKNALYKEGQEFRVKYKKCTCENSAVTCVYDSFRDDCEFCGSILKHGQSEQSGYQICTCRYGQVSCKEGTLVVSGSRDCEYVDATGALESFNHGDIWEDRAANAYCSCHYGDAHCHQNIAETLGCNVGGLMVIDGESFTSGYFHCTCKHSNLYCETKAVERHACDGFGKSVLEGNTIDLGYSTCICENKEMHCTQKI